MEERKEDLMDITVSSGCDKVWRDRSFDDEGKEVYFGGGGEGRG